MISNSSRPIFETCRCSIDLDFHTPSRRQPPIPYVRLTACSPVPNIPGRCERHQTAYLKNHERGLLEYLSLKVDDLEQRLNNARQYPGLYTNEEMLNMTKQAKAEKTARGLAALGLWNQYPRRWGLCAVKAEEGGGTILVRIQDMEDLEVGDDGELDRGWWDEGDEDVSCSCEEVKVRTQSEKAGLREKVGVLLPEKENS